MLSCRRFTEVVFLTRPPVCLSLLLPVCLSVSLYVCMRVCFSICLSIYLTICPSVFFSVCRFVFVHLRATRCLYICVGISMETDMSYLREYSKSEEASKVC